MSLPFQFADISKGEREPYGQSRETRDIYLRIFSSCKNYARIVLTPTCTHFGVPVANLYETEAQEAAPTSREALCRSEDLYEVTPVR